MTHVAAALYLRELLQATNQPGDPTHNLTIWDPAREH